MTTCERTFFYGGDPGMSRGDSILPGEAALRPSGFGSEIAAFPSNRLGISDNVPAALLIAVLQHREPIVLYEVSAIGEIEADPRGAASSARSFAGLGETKLYKEALVVNVVDLQPEVVAKVREMVATSQESIPNFTKRLAAERRKNNLAALLKGMENNNKSATKRAFQKKQRKIHRAAGRRGN